MPRQRIMRQRLQPPPGSLINAPAHHARAAGWRAMLIKVVAIKLGGGADALLGVGVGGHFDSLARR